MRTHEPRIKTLEEFSSLIDISEGGSLTVTGDAVVSGTNTGDQTISLTGDVTGSGTGSFATTISANAVTDAKFRQSAGLSVVGRSANSTGDVADITAGTDNFVLRRSGTSLAFGTIVNANIDASAAIAYSKLNLASSIVNADISASAAIAYSKLNLTSSIVNADVSSSAAIAGTKISPDFGSQNVITTGHYRGASSATVPTLTITGTTTTGFGQLTSTLLFIFSGTATYAITSTQFQGVAGTSTNPGYSSASDTNTGVHLPGSDVLNLVTGGTIGLSISASQVVTIGTGTGTTHVLNTQLGTAAADALTLLNGPTGKAGNPAVYIQVNVNGTNRVIPAW